MRFPLLTKENLQKWYIHENKTTLEIAKIVGCADWTVSTYLKKYEIPLRPVGPKFKNLLNEKFDKLIVLDKHKKSNFRGAFWKCQCDCGKIVIRSGSYLLKNDIHHHCGCGRPSGVKNKAWKGGKYISYSLFKRMEQTANIAGRKFNVTIEQLENLFDKQNGKCALSGIILKFATIDKNRTDTTASLDRIDNTKDYEIDNVWWVHKDVNRMKWAYPLDYFIELCKKIGEYSVKNTL